MTEGNISIVRDWEEGNKDKNKILGEAALIVRTAKTSEALTIAVQETEAIDVAQEAILMAMDIQIDEMVAILNEAGGE